MIPQERVTAAARQLVELSQWIDESNAHRDPEAILWGRVAKVAEESGEAIGALVARTGQNPRKAATDTDAELIAELLDVAIAALGAIEHITGHERLALPFLLNKIDRVHARAVRGPVRFL